MALSNELPSLSSAVAPKSNRARALLQALSNTHTAQIQPAATTTTTSGSGPVQPPQPVLQLSLTEDGPDQAALTWVRVALSSDVELIRAGWRLRAGPSDTALACRVMGALSHPQSRELEVRERFCCAGSTFGQSG